MNFFLIDSQPKLYLEWLLAWELFLRSQWLFKMLTAKQHGADSPDDLILKMKDEMKEADLVNVT